MIAGTVYRFSFYVCVAFFAVDISSGLTITGAVAQAPPRVGVLYSADLLDAKKRLQSGDASLVAAFNKLKRDAERALGGGTFSVVNKNLVPPSGDKHDYMSIAPYWWPNPNSPNGLPYVRRDGKVNPERNSIPDKKNLESMIASAKTLSLAYFFTGNENYAAHTAKILRVWFLHAETRMNPNLKFAQAVPGRNQGRAAGIIESHNLPTIVDAVGLLAGSPAWNENHQRQLRLWFDAFLTWMLESPEGRAESKAQNNHGIWYDVQIASFALFVDRKELVKRILSEVPSKRIAKQIDPDGRQPRELERTQAWSYSLFNLEALFNAAAIADKLGIDLWNYETTDKRGIRKALDWLVPFATGEKKWSHQQFSNWQPEKLAPLLRRAALRYREPSYERAITKLAGFSADQRMNLLYPKHAGAVTEQSSPK